MHPAFSFTVLYGPQIAGWIFANKEPLAATFDRFGGAVAGSLTGGTQRLDRIGGTLVALDGNQREVIGLLHRHEDKLDGMGRAADGRAGRTGGIAGPAHLDVGGHARLLGSHADPAARAIPRFEPAAGFAVAGGQGDPRASRSSGRR